MSDNFGTFGGLGALPCSVCSVFPGGSRLYCNARTFEFPDLSQWRGRSVVVLGSRVGGLTCAQLTSSLIVLNLRGTVSTDDGYGEYLFAERVGIHALAFSDICQLKRCSKLRGTRVLGLHCGGEFDSTSTGVSTSTAGVRTSSTTVSSSSSSSSTSTVSTPTTTAWSPLVLLNHTQIVSPPLDDADQAAADRRPANEAQDAWWEARSVDVDRDAMIRVNPEHLPIMTLLMEPSTTEWTRLREAGVIIDPLEFERRVATAEAEQRKSALLLKPSEIGGITLASLVGVLLLTMLAALLVHRRRRLRAGRLTAVSAGLSASFFFFAVL